MVSGSFFYSSIGWLGAELGRKPRSLKSTISTSRRKRHSHSKDTRVISRLYDSSMVSCPNTGLRHLPADYKAVLDNFYLDCVAKKRSGRQEPTGRFLTAEQFVAGDRSSRSLRSRGSVLVT